MASTESPIATAANPGRPPVCQMIDGSLYSMFLDPVLFRKAAELKTEDGDIIQVTFPKCGTHWVQQIIQLILNKGESPRDFEEFVKRAPFLEYQGAEALEGMASPRTIRTHLPMNKIAFNKNAKYVYVARNPWDCCMSSYHFMTMMPQWQMREATFDDFLKVFVKGEWGFGDYFEHVMGAYKLRDEPNVFFVTYEQLKEDTRGTILKLAFFLGEDYGRMLENDKDLMEDVMRKSGTEYMRDIVKTSNANLASLFIKNPLLVSRLPKPSDDEKESKGGKISFVRVGKVDGWKEEFTQHQLRILQEKIEEISKDSDVMDLWKKQWLSAKEEAAK